ncbi:MAG: hypothetical protein JO199_03820 [Candidatus Eremiobacteraeota bacterium]|nr:hypothetical protein [Candidatus Eremiobacteraeota bacterium]
MIFAAFAFAVAAADSPRCNATMVDTLQAQVREYDRQGSGGDAAARRKRFAALDGVLHELDEERGVLHAVCASDEPLAALDAQLSATAAWALVQQAGLGASLTTCPAAGPYLETALLAQAWLDLATSAKDVQGNAALVAVQPKVEGRAAAAGLKLPAFADTSDYWRSQTDTQARAAAARVCAQPSPAPAP